MKLIRKEYGRDVITGEKVRLQTDVESDKHEAHCLVFWIKFESRTIHSCNCSEKKAYQENFHKMREPKTPEQ